VTATDRTAGDRAEILLEALPYIQRFRQKIVVVKFGGNAMVDPALADSFAADMVLLRAVGIRPVVVHGGGPQIGQLLGRLGIESEFKDGLRVTDADVLDVARMVLVGKVNRDLVGAINTHGPLAVGLSGEDGGLITSVARDPELGYVGDVESINPTILHRLLAEDLIPVVSTIGGSAEGQAYNINADTVAGALGAALQAEKVIYLTDVPGLLEDVERPDSLIRSATVGELRRRIADGVLTGGMIPKIEAAASAVEHGVPAAHLLDGRIEHVVLLELFSDEGVGTMITRHPQATDQGGRS